MATITTARRTYKDTGSTTDCTCMRIVRTDGTTYRYTDCDIDLAMTTYNLAGTITAIGATRTYLTVSGFDMSALGASVGQASQLDLEGILGAVGFGRDEISTGLFNKARVYIFATNWANPVEDDECLLSAFWGETTLSGGRYVTKISSLLDVMEADTTRSISLLCDTKLGALRCGVNLAPSAWVANTQYSAILNGDQRVGSRIKPTVQNFYWYSCTTAGTSGGTEPTWSTTLGGTTSDGTITWTTIKALKLTLDTNGGGGTDGIVGIISPLPASFVDHFENGFVTVNSGNNAGLSKRVITNSTTNFTCDIAFSKQMTALSTVTVTAGCLKRHVTDCETKYNNYKNHQGNPYLPGKINIYRRGTS